MHKFSILSFDVGLHIREHNFVNLQWDFYNAVWDLLLSYSPLSLPPLVFASKAIQWTKQSRRTNAYEPVTCLACKRIHLVKPKTGDVLGDRI